jgi:hypothetical protein
VVVVKLAVVSSLSSELGDGVVTSNRSGVNEWCRLDNLRTLPKFNHECSLGLLSDGAGDGLLYLRRSSSAHGKLLLGVRDDLLDDEFEPPSPEVSCIDCSSLVNLTVSVDNCGNELVDLHGVDSRPERVDHIDEVNEKIEVARERVV